MIFQHTCDLVIAGTKTQTRRLVRLGDALSGTGYAVCGLGRKGQDIARFEVGRTYAVQPGRGKKAVGRIKITGIRHEDVRHITAADAKAEGFDSIQAFWIVWTAMHDKSLNLAYYPQDGAFLYEIDKGGYGIAYGVQAMREVLLERPAPRYTAWALTFELVEPAPAALAPSPSYLRYHDLEGRDTSGIRHKGEVVATTGRFYDI